MSKPPFDFTDKTVFVAGGTSGINLGIARAFAQAGARLAVMSRKQDKVDSAVAELKQLGPAAIGFAADVRQFDAVEAAFKSTKEQLGEIDVLISGAAGNFPAPAVKSIWRNSRRRWHARRGDGCERNPTRQVAGFIPIVDTI